MSTENVSNEEKGNGVLADVMAMLPMHGTHKTLGRIEILGVRVKSTTSNNTMYMTIIDGEFEEYRIPREVIDKVFNMNVKDYIKKIKY